MRRHARKQDFEKKAERAGGEGVERHHGEQTENCRLVLVHLPQHVGPTQSISD